MNDCKLLWKMYVLEIEIVCTKLTIGVTLYLIIIALLHWRFYFTKHNFHISIEDFVTMRPQLHNITS